MNNEPHYSVAQRIQVSLVVVSLLALLLVILSSTAQQHFFAARMDHGFVGPLNDLTIATHSESYRAQIGKQKQNTAGSDDGDQPNWWCAHSASSWFQLNVHTPSAVEGTEQPLLTSRFILPLLRAPPVSVILR